jgi:hypothetical protein
MDAASEEKAPPAHLARTWAEVARTLPLPVIVVCQVATTLRVFGVV